MLSPYTPPRSGYGATSIVHFKDNENNSLNMELVCKKPFEGISISNDFLSVESSKSQFTQEIGQSIELTKAIKKIELTENAEYRSSQNITLNVNTLKSEHFAWEEMAEPNGAVKQFTPQCNFAINSYLDKGSEINLFILIDVISSDDIHISNENFESIGIDVKANVQNLANAGLKLKTNGKSESILMFDKVYNVGFKMKEIRSLIKHGDTSTPKATIKLI
jgi:hypothetical protein